MARITEKGENERCTLQDLEYGEKKEKRVKWKKNTVGPGIWRGTLKNVENKNYTLQDLKYGKKQTNKNLKIMENERKTLQGLEYDKKTENHRK